MSDTNRRTNTAINQAINYRNYRRIRDRALRRLGQENPNRYKELLEEERARDEAEGKTWIDLSGRTSSSLGSPSAPNRGSEVPIKHQDRNGGEEGELGGEA